MLKTCQLLCSFELFIFQLICQTIILAILSTEVLKLPQIYFLLKKRGLILSNNVEIFGWKISTHLQYIKEEFIVLQSFKAIYFNN